MSFARASARSVVVATCAIAFAGLAAGAIRVLPWLLDPSVPWRVAGPFARGLAAVAVESALLAGWPLGWSFACFRLVESGEARVLQTLGESPRKTIARLGWQGVIFGLLLASVAVIYGRDAGAPGRVATELLTRARAECAIVKSPATYAIPFTNLTWLCAPGRPPRLVGALSGFLAPSSVLSARGARIAGDFRVLELDDARVLVDGAPSIAVHVASLSIRGMPAWAQASTLPPPWRALVLVLSACVAAVLAAYAVLRQAARTRAGVLLIGAAGPLASLGLMRLLERLGSGPPLFVLVPMAGGICTLAVGVLVGLIPKPSPAYVPWHGFRALALQTGRRAASTESRKF